MQRDGVVEHGWYQYEFAWYSLSSVSPSRSDVEVAAVELQNCIVVNKSVATVLSMEFVSESSVSDSCDLDVKIDD